MLNYSPVSIDHCDTVTPNIYTCSSTVKTSTTGTRTTISSSSSTTTATSWSDEGAPFASQNFTPSQLLWFPFLAILTKTSIQALNDKSQFASLIWILYESYIIFDHIPFLFTNNVYKSPRFNFTYLSTIFFWGMEGIASIVSTQSDVNAPNVLLYNALPHSFFIACNNFGGLAASKAFTGEQKKVWWVYVQVAVDNVIHGVSLWYHLKYMLLVNGYGYGYGYGYDYDYVGGSVNVIDPSPLVLSSCWFGIVTSMLLLTCWVHGDEMSWRYFLDPLIPKTRKA